MICAAHFSVAPAEDGQRLDAVLRSRYATSSASLVQHAIGSGGVTVNGRVVPKGHKLRTGEKVELAHLPELADQRVAPNPDLPLEVLFADDDMVAANKPAGMDVHPLRLEETGTLANALVARWPELAELGDQPLMAGIVHRIDGETSGLVLAARNATACAALRGQFAAQTVRKEYIALVTGAVEQGGTLVHELAHQPWRRGRMIDARRLRDADRPMHAETTYSPVRRVGSYTLLNVTIFTGVTHQIRCQLGLAGHPVVGDTLYGAPAVDGFPRHFLHAAAIALAHPRTGVPLRIEAPLTPDLRAFLSTCH